SKRSPWFLESWSSRETKHDSSLDYEDAKDLPIELRRLEDFDDLPEPPLSAGLKSRSLGAQIPESKATLAAEPTPVSRRPKLVKQKQSLCDDVDYKFTESSAQAYREHGLRNESRVQLLRKQSSLNEELMAESRLREKERIRKRIQKQISLNESFLCRSLFTKRLQVIKEGFATKLKTSTGSLERVTKNGFVKIIQNIKAATPAAYHGGPTGGGGGGSGTGGGHPHHHHHHHHYHPHHHHPNHHLPHHLHHNPHGPPGGRPPYGYDSDDCTACPSCLAGMYPEHDEQIPFSSASTASNSNTFTFEDTVILPWQLEQQETATKEPPGMSSTGGTEPSVSETVIRSTSPGTNAADNAIASTTTKAIPSSSAGKTEPPRTASRRNSSTEGKPHVSPQKANSQKITRQQIKDLPPIPKFRRSGNYPILRRQTSAAAGSSTTAPVPVPKLLSLELFNPETDDLDSDSSEPSSPDSIDSVISALRPSLSPLPAGNATGTGQQQPQPSGSGVTDVGILIPAVGVPTIPPLVEAAAVVAHKLEDVVDMAIPERVGIDGKPMRFNGLRTTTTGSSVLSHATDVDDHDSRQHLVDFAEKLSAQLLKELENEKKRNESFDEDDDVFAVDCRIRPGSAIESPPIVDPYLKKLNGDLRDLNQLRAELRERRLMLANLSNMGSGGGLGGQFGGSNDSLGPSYGSSMAPIIQEETDDDEEFNELEERRMHGLENVSAGSQPLAGPSVLKVMSSLKCKNLGGKTVDDFVIIPELDEDDPELSNDTTLLIQEEDSSEEHLHASLEPERPPGTVSGANVATSGTSSTTDNCRRRSKVSSFSSAKQLTAQSQADGSFHHGSSSNNNSGTHVPPAPATCSGIPICGGERKTLSATKKSSIPSFESHASVDSWAHSTSTASLDSPSIGGSATHHRYYHVFREGELDALINHHVTSLHIVSSYYERASWCVVAEKVHVWTI
uniref:Uncharacterized protein n=1 Tax=Anopheles melas TaxID=34690 RepID=A0A182TXV7_9DIPT